MIDLSIDWRVLGFTFALSVLAGLVFGLLPTMHAVGIDLVFSLKTRLGSGRAQRSRFSFQQMLITGQMAVSLVVLIVAGLLLSVAHVLPGRRMLPHWGRIADLAHTGTAIAVIPLVLSAVGVYARARAGWQ